MDDRWNDGRRDDRWVRPTVLSSPLDPTHARPEPWFVGSGRGLMILVVSLCIVLLVARGVTIVWMAEAAWDWFRGSASEPPRSPSSAPPAPPAPPAPFAASALPPPAPLDVMERPRATPVGSLGTAFDRDSYPPEALRAGEEGRVVARLAIGIDGRPTGCTVATSSRSPSLDRATCAIGVARTRYRAARDADGRSVPSRYDLAVRWTLEE